MHKVISLIIVVLIMGAGVASAQEATIKRVEALPFEVIPALQQRKDLNGEPCALVRVEVLADDVKFSGNIIGEVEHATGHYRVFLSPGTKMLRIESNSFLPVFITLPDYGINGVQPNGVYVITLSLPEGTAQKSASAGMNYLIMNVTPPSATVTVGGKQREVRNGSAKILLRNSTSYPYRVEAPGYIAEEGQIAMGTDKMERNITLRSIKGSLTVNTTTPGTEIYVNGERKGTGTWSDNLMPGSYTIEGRLEGYISVSERVDIATGDTRTVTLSSLSSTKGSLTVNTTTPGTEIYVNGERMGADTWSGALMPGDFLVEGRRTSHRNAEQLVTLETGENETVTLPALVPITGSLNVDYEPMGATISIDGTPRGATPAIIEDLLTGPHTVTISADGYTPASVTATIADGQLTELTGALTLQPAYEEVHYKYFRDPTTKKEGFKDESGKIVIPAKFDNVRNFREGLSRVIVNSADGYRYKSGYIDKTGKFVIPLKFDTAESFYEGLAYVRINDKWGFIDHSGNIAIPLKFSRAHSFCEGLACVYIDGKCGFIDKTGQFIIPAKFDYSERFNEGLAFVKVDDKWGFIDHSGEFVITPIFDGAYNFSEGLAAVKIGKKYGFINKAGEVVIPPKYDDVPWEHGFKHGVASVSKGNKIIYIDKQGNKVKY